MAGQILLDDSFCELSELESRFSFGKNNDECFSLTVITSLGCNFDCPYCYELKAPQVLSKQVADEIIEIISKKVEEVSKIQIHWLGGEPLIGLRQIEYLSRKILDLCDGKAEFVSFITTKGQAKKYHPSHSGTIVISHLASSNAGCQKYWTGCKSSRETVTPLR